ncbi:MAG: threonine synthase [Candidatus Fermentithermobacillus carboniphilus]|uniref:Threonine synthase n=1 Tax=Candidatus Fermentithermobacillus carboniphilus TaxID=3085328 RepID=A0AAT9LBC0_9FIRM|nr:MAG: threonine synthase [Candidatus Fermentithermobacillus carboniphilus]
MKSYLKTLECPRCGKTYDPSKLVNTCECGTPLLVRYDLETLKKEAGPEIWKTRRRGLWRYKELLPVTDEKNIVSLGEGGTPVLPMKGMGKVYGLKNLYLKDEGLNPTGTFKARGASVGVSRAKELGAKALAMPTAGNAGAAWAAYSARAGLKMVVAMPEDAPVTTQAECVAYGASTYLVRGLISDAGRVVREASQRHGWFEVATLKEPYRIEGKKTMGLEIWEDFDGKMPAAIIYPTGGGVGLIGMWKAFSELKALGWLSGPLPKMVVVQAEGCAPIVRAYREGKNRAEFFQGACTIAAGIRVPSALGDFLVLDAVRSSGGTCVSVSDGEILDTWKEVARRDGMLICPEGAAAVRAAKIVADMGLIGPDDPVLVLNTGAGMKYVELLNEKARKLEEGELPE